VRASKRAYMREQGRGLSDVYVKSLIRQRAPHLLAAEIPNGLVVLKRSQIALKRAYRESRNRA
jgi:hypothetical protein